MKFDEAKELAINLIKKHGLGYKYGLSSWWNFKWINTKRILGRCDYLNSNICLSKFFVSQSTRKQVRNTILHEIAHALVGPHHNHDKVWKAKAIEIGCTGERCSKILLKGKYVVFHKETNEIFYYTYREPSDDTCFRYIRKRKKETLGKLTWLPTKKFEQLLEQKSVNDSIISQTTKTHPNQGESNMATETKKKKAPAKKAKASRKKPVAKKNSVSKEKLPKIELLIETATVMNDVMGLEPEIVIDGKTAKDIAESIKMEIGDVLETDPFEPEVWKVLKQLGYEASKPKSKQTKAKASKKKGSVKKSEGPSNKEIIYKAWKKGKGTKDPEKLLDLVNNSVKETTVKGWLNSWKNGNNLPSCAK